MKICSFSKYCNHGPSSRYRLYPLIEPFRRAGVEFGIHPLLETPYFEILRKNRSLSKSFQKARYVAERFMFRRKEVRELHADLFHIEHQLFPYFPHFLERRWLPEKYLVEFDDAIYITHPRKFPQVLKGAAGVIAGNHHLAQYAAKWNSQVHVVPTVLDTDKFRPEHRARAPKIVIGWSGLEYNFKHLKYLEPVLSRLVQRYPVEVVVLSGSPPTDFSFPFRFEKWDPEYEVKQLNAFDIGLMPLQFDEWCKGKCGFKLLQYMALEIASVATPVGVNARIIRDGENGFVAKTLEDWESTLQELVRNDSLRSRVGKSGRQTVVEQFSLDIWFPRILEIYRSYLNA